MSAVIFAIQHYSEAIVRELTYPEDLEINRTISIYRQIGRGGKEVWQGCFYTKSAFSLSTDHQQTNCS